MPSPEEQAMLVKLVARVKQLFATTFIGFTLATTLYGITVLQTYFYYRKYPKDHWFLKSFVATLWSLDTLTTIFVAHSLYVYFIFNYGLNPAINLVIPWSFIVEKLLVSIITVLAQLFYARSIWKVSDKKIIPSIILILAIVTFALGIVTTVHLFQEPNAAAISINSFSIISGLVQALAAVNDILITASLSWFLHSKRSGLRSTEDIVDTLILHAVSRGTLTAVTQILFLVLNVSLPHDTYWQPFHQCVGKLYVNSVLASLNIRSSLGARGTSSGTVEGQSSGLNFRSATITHDDMLSTQTSERGANRSVKPMFPHPSRGESSTTSMDVELRGRKSTDLGSDN